MTRAVIRMSIEDAPHIGEAQRKTIIDSYPAWERDARVRGIPALGSGRVFPVDEETLIVEPRVIPKHWALIGGLDLGYTHPTAAVRLAHDRDVDMVYVTAAYRVAEQPVLYHASALREWGTFPWSWPHDALKHDSSEKTYMSEYSRHGLSMLPESARFADGGNGVQIGLEMMLERMLSGRFKVFSNLTEWLEEFREYHRKDGIIHKVADDLMDATRYAIMSLRFAETPMEKKAWQKVEQKWVV